MTSPRQAVVLLLLGFVIPLSAQNSSAPRLSSPAPSPSPFWTNRNHVFFDPAHGGDDTGARLTARTLEKDATASLAARLRTLLTSAGLTVLLARDTDPAAPANAPSGAALSNAAPTPNPDQRAGAANHSHPFACLLLHATAAGSGVHIVTSTLAEPDPGESAAGASIPWNTAQALYVAQSDRLAAELATALARAGLPVRRLHATLRPLDSMTCPAVALELAPVNGASAADSGYQQRVAQALATALSFWRAHADPAAAAQPPSSQPTGSGTEP